ncbi:hypothetical protein [Amycolatopsis sp. NBC_01480]|uniref:hypothetical protein n=1 Tax=Amycolatopsis sp. NBC_01480 TaxID=2903562 RepID=UPI002E2C0D35|nr:hypothetical protein [Amycolatopsis sp. NBC_01480]
MEDLDVRSALSSYVTEDEPPIGLSGAAVLAAGRRSRRRRLVAATGGAVVVLVAAVTLAVSGPGPQAPPPASGTACATKSADTRTRLACVIGDAVRSRLSPSARIERLTIPGETAPADPFLPAVTGESMYQLGVRVTDQHGAGAVYVQLIAVDGLSVPRCTEVSPPNPDGCGVSQLSQGALQTITYRRGGLITYEARLSAPGWLAVVTTNNSGVLRHGLADAVAVQSPLPPLTAEQAADVVLTRGLIP